MPHFKVTEHQESLLKSPYVPPSFAGAPQMALLWILVNVCVHSTCHIALVPTIALPGGKSRAWSTWMYTWLEPPATGRHR